MSDPSWKEHFNQPISGYDPIEAQGLSELGYALLHSQIDEQEYLAWARKNFELCSVDVNFFQKNPPPVALVRRLKEVYPWSPEIMPVAEWDGHVIVLAIEKPQLPVPPELKPIVLLAPVSCLNPHWEACLKDLEENVHQIIEVSDALEGISLEPPTAVTSLDFSALRGGSTQSKIVSEATQTVLVANPPSTNEISLEITAVTALHPDPTPAKPDMMPKPTPATVKPAHQMNTHPASAKSDPTPLNINMTDFSMSPTAVTVTDQLPEIKTQPRSVSGMNSEGLPNEEKILESLTQFAKLYEDRCYLEFNLAKKSVKVSLWPIESTKITVIPTEISIQQDHFIKIVATTQKSYHGHIVKSPSIEKLFKEINAGVWPENVTLVPILKSGEVIGGIMGWGPKSTYNMSVLREMESIVNELTLQLGFKSQDAA